MDLTEKVVELIKEKWVLTNETANRVYFKYKEHRGMPKFYYDKASKEVVRVDTSVTDKRNSSKEALSVEVKTAIYSLIDSTVTPVNAYYVFSNRNTDEGRQLVKKYGGSQDLKGDAS